MAEIALTDRIGLYVAEVLAKVHLGLGGDPIRHPQADERWMVTREVWRAEQEEYAIVLALAVVLTLGKIIIGGYIVRPTVRRVGVQGEDVNRIVESFWQLLFYATSWTGAAYILWSKEWFYRPILVWEPPFPFQVMSDETWLLYIVEMGWYVHCTFTHLVLDKRTKDFWPMLIHHAATLVLMHSAFVSGYFRIGVTVIYCMDVCDIFLHICKILRCLDNWNVLEAEFMKFIFFPPLVLARMYFRLYVYTTSVVWVSSGQGAYYAGYWNADMWCFYNVLLLVLLGLQLHWFSLISKTAVKHVLYGDRLDDERDLSKKAPLKGEKAS